MRSRRRTGSWPLSGIRIGIRLRGQMKSLRKSMRRTRYYLIPRRKKPTTSLVMLPSSREWVEGRPVRGRSPPEADQPLVGVVGRLRIHIQQMVGALSVETLKVLTPLRLLNNFLAADLAARQATDSGEMFMRLL